MGFKEEFVTWRVGPLGESALRAKIDEAQLRVPEWLKGFTMFDASQKVFSKINGFDKRIVLNKETNLFSQVENWQFPVDRYVLFANKLHELNATGKYFVNFFDAQPWDYTEIIGGGFDFPVYQYCRRIGQKGIILWPIEKDYLGPNGQNCPVRNWDTLPFQSKSNSAVFRGRFSGTYYNNGQLFWGEGLANELARNHTNLSKYFLDVAFYEFPRYRLISRHRDSKSIDVGFTFDNHTQPMKQDDKSNFFRSLFKEPRPKSEMLKHKFILCVEGNDGATGLFWALNSNSIVLMETPRWETLMHFGLKEWQHFIPVDKEYSDIDEKMAWASANESECLNIIERANSLMRELNNEAMRADADKSILELYQRHMQMGQDEGH